MKKINDTLILGISAYFHDSAAALIQNGNVIYAAEEERFSRIKGDANFPIQAINDCLSRSKVQLSDIDYIAYFEKPFKKFDRILNNFLLNSPRCIKSFMKYMPEWLGLKLFPREQIRNELKKIQTFYSMDEMPPILFLDHHQSHAASAFYPSPFENAAILCVDGVGEWATTSTWIGNGNEIKPLWEIQFPHSLGLLYSAFTYYLGFKVNFGEYKLMGLAPYGEPKYINLILNELIDLKEDGTFKLNMDYFSYTYTNCMINSSFEKLFGGPKREPETIITQREMDIARSIQEVTEMIMIRLANSLYQETECENLCLAGGVALNCVANSKIREKTPFQNIWIQPAAGDAGSALGCALSVWHQYLQQPRYVTKTFMNNSYLGPSYNDSEIPTLLKEYNAIFHYYNDESDLLNQVADLLASENVVGWFNGRMEFGPRALGNRSILADPRDEAMQSKVNLKIKFRESFRPFAPVIKEDKLSEYFEFQDSSSPYMLFVAPVKPSQRIETALSKQLTGLERLNIKRSNIPAVTHVDYSARIQTVTREQNQRLYNLLDAFEIKTGCPVLINTSFNVRGEPIVCTPIDAYKCFMNTHMDVLVLGNYLFYKTEQKKFPTNSDLIKNQFGLD